MRCSKAKKLISDYVDNELKERQSVHLERHFHKCSDCRKLLEDFKSIAKSAKELDELKPSQGTWLKIRERLTPEEQKVLSLHPDKRGGFGFLFFPPKLKYALSAFLVMAVIISAVMVGQWYRGGMDILGKRDPMKYTLAKLDEAEQHYKMAIKALWEAVSYQEGNLTPKVAEVFRKNLEIIDSSITDCRQTVLLEPENIDARDFLLAAYRDKVDFLQDMMEIGRPSSPKKESKKVM
jgi:hypothetical protein